MVVSLMFVINPFFNWVYMVYGIFTAGQRTWEVLEPMLAQRTRTPQHSRPSNMQKPRAMISTSYPKLSGLPPTQEKGSVPLQPSDHLEGRFAPAERLPGGWYQQGNDSGLTLPNMLPRN
jgi:chitin synthase